MSPVINRNPVGGLFRGARTKEARSFRDFAEAEIILPNGPRKGLPFSCDFMPWSALLLDEFTAGNYRRYFGAGPVQSGKTLLFFQIPILYHLFEIEETVIVGVPKIDMAQSIYDERILPVILKTKYREMLPVTGAGSRGGKFDSIKFANGAILRFMGAGGGDEQRASHTARVVILTEIDKMDRPGAASREADPVTQLEARSSAFGDMARIYAECTMSIDAGRINREVTKVGTHTRVYVPCNHCGEYAAPEREHFTGWEGAEDVFDARENAGYVCEHCGAIWSEADRAKSLQKPVLASEGQTVNKAGKVTGDTRRTHTLGFRWNRMVSPLITMAFIAEIEYLAETSGQEEDEMAVHQFTWAMPYSGSMAKSNRIEVDAVLKKIGRFKRGIAPAGCELLTVAIDIGLYQCWWEAWSWRKQAIGYLVDYGMISVAQGPNPTDLNILSSLRVFRDEFLKPGWAQLEVAADGTETHRPLKHKLCLIDAQYKPDIVHQFIKESGIGYQAAKGLGTSRGQENWPKSLKNSKDRTVGHECFAKKQPGGETLLSVHSDYWKGQIHDGFAAKPGEPGSLQIYDAEPIEHRLFAQHITAEHEEEEFLPDRGLVRIWKCLSRNNHYLDVNYMARCAAEICGIKRLISKEKKSRQRPRPPAKTPKKRSIRTRY